MAAITHGYGHKIFRDINSLFDQPLIFMLPNSLDFPAHDAEQTFVARIKNARS